MKKMNIEVRVDGDDVYVGNNLYTFDGATLQEDERIVVAIAKYLDCYHLIEF